MGWRRRILGAALGLALAAGLGYAAWRIHASRQVQFCTVCSRPLHAQNKTAGLRDGRKELFCCPTCALTAHLQTSKPIEITALTDYETTTTLSPGDAYIVKGSAVNLCIRQHVMTDEHKQAARLDFDRCSPSILAFARRDSAEAFVRQHGGVLLRFEELEASYRR